MVTLKKPANTNIPKNATGRPKATQKANRVFKKRERKINTKIIPMMAFSVNNWVRCTKVVDWSETMSSLTLLYF